MVRLIVTDLDDTIYNWSGFYIPAFRAMVRELNRITGVPESALRASFQRVHRAHRTTEYAFAIEELDVLAEIDAGLSIRERLEKYHSAIRAFRDTRKATLALFPTVRESLETLRTVGVPVVAVSDSMMSYVGRRLRQLNVDTLFAAICAPRDHGLPDGLHPETVRRARPEDVDARTELLEADDGVRKPDPRLMLPILKRFRVQAEDVVLIGDSLLRDVLMAQRSGIVDVWAKYGREHHEQYYEEIREITYWSDPEIAEEERLRAEAGSVSPSHIVERFSELLDVCGVLHHPSA